MKFEESQLVLHSQVIPAQQWAVSSQCLSFGLVNKTGACMPIPSCYLTGALRAAVV